MRSKPGFSRPCRCLSHLGGNVDRSIAPLGSRQGTDVLEDRRKIASKSRGKICQVWTVLHYFDCRAADGTPPASRFFRRSFPDLFESVLSQIDALPMPRQRRQALAAST